MSSFSKRKIETKFNIEKVPNVLEKLRAFEISMKELEKCSSTLEKLSEILISSDLQLPPLSYENFNAEHENAEVQKLTNFLHKIRIISISLLNCKKMNQLETQKNLKRRSTSTSPKEIKCQKIPKTSNFLKEICYICKGSLPSSNLRYNTSSWMCRKCGEFNFQKRSIETNLSGKVCLVTGGRIKIGFEIALKLLRCRAQSVIVTTRFPADAFKRFESQIDYSDWKDKLHIYKLDLRFLSQVERFCEQILKDFRKLDILIQNAAQTIRKPTFYYKDLIEGEEKANLEMVKYDSEKNTSLQVFDSPCASNPSQLFVHKEDYKYKNNPLLAFQHFPKGIKDCDGQQLDLRTENSWVLELDQVETMEMVEVSLVNYMAPYIILSKLTQLMKRNKESKGKSEWSFIILVSAMEGKFTKCYKTSRHPHTNGAKAGLNMLVRTSAKYYKSMGILMNAVDTGWVTDEHPINYKGLENFIPPLDSLDWAARVLDPIFKTLNGNDPHFGNFFKDYKPTGW